MSQTAFGVMLEERNARQRIEYGKKPKLSILDRLVITLMYRREYRTYENIAFDYGVKKSVIRKQIICVEDTLLESGKFSLPARRELLHNQKDRKVVIVDVIEQQNEGVADCQLSATPSAFRHSKL